MSRGMRSTLLGVLALLALSAFPPLAQASLEIKPGDVSIELLKAGGQTEDRAGSTPDRMILHYKVSEGPGPAETLRDLKIELPSGLIGRSGAAPLCSRVGFEQLPYLFSAPCGADSQVGNIFGTNPLTMYLLEPAPGESTAFGASFAAEAGRVFTTAGANGEGLTMRIVDIPTPPALVVGASNGREGEIELWGIPADHQEGTAIPRRPLLTTATNCAKVPSLIVSARSWQQPERWVTAATNTAQPLTGCSQIPFDAAIAMTLEQSHADSPTGSSFDITAPLNADPDARANSAIRGLDLALPRGMTISLPGSAGLATCGDERFGLGNETEPTCPPTSRVGSVEVQTDPEAKPLAGRIYLGQEHPDERFRLFIAADGPGTKIKIAGALRPDPQTGRLNVVFAKLPEVLMSKMTLSLDGGPGALLATPTTCATATTDATLTPYSATAPITRSAAVRIDGCPAAVPFAPTFSAGTASALAGAPTSFVARIGRKDGEGMPDRVTIQMPPGLAGALGSVEACSDGAARVAACPGSSRIGSATTELGPGPETARLKGDLYLTAPYKSAPFGIEIVLPAKIGPYDLGSLAIRGTIDLDRASGQVTVATDPLPREIEGIAVRLRSLGLTIDRPGFLRNPTSCAPSTVDADIRSTEAARAKPSSPFRVSGCVDLPLKPSFALKLTDRSEQRKNGRPGLRIGGKLAPGGANMRNADIHLPAALKLDSSQLKAICSRADAIRNRCQKAAIVGKASGISPSLATPLKGAVYAVAPEGGGTPDVWATLSGQGVEILLKGEIALHKGRIEAKLVDLPDFPLRSFALNLDGGEDGLFVLRRSPCAKPLGVPIDVEGQNKALRHLAPRLGVACGRG